MNNQSNFTLKAGMKFLFTPSNTQFEIARVTDKNVSWYVGFTYKTGTGANNMKMAYTSVTRFLKGIESGAYKLITQ